MPNSDPEAHNLSCREWAARNPDRRREIKRASYQRRVDTHKKHYEAYVKTPKGFLVRTYRNMQNRVEGKVKPHLYEGKELMPRETFYSWALSDKEFLRLFSEWESSGYSLKVCPSIDRIDSAGGYVPGNIRWLTHSQNSTLGAKARHEQ